MAKQTSVRIAEPLYARLEAASAVTGLPINSILVVAAMEWLDSHPPERLLGGGSTVPALLEPAEPEDLVPADEPFERLDERARRALAIALQLARRSRVRFVGPGGGGLVGPEHLMLALLRDRTGVVSAAVEAAGAEPDQLRQGLEARATAIGPATVPFPPLLLRQGTFTTSADASLRPLQNAVREAFAEAKRLGDDHVGPEHLLLGLLAADEPATEDTLAQAGLTRIRVQEAIERLRAGGDAPA